MLVCNESLLRGLIVTKASSFDRKYRFQSVRRTEASDISEKISVTYVSIYYVSQYISHLIPKTIKVIVVGI